jgi:hypothetical protein
MGQNKKILGIAALLATVFGATNAFAGDADIQLPSLQDVSFYQGICRSYGA